MDLIYPQKRFYQMTKIIWITQNVVHRQTSRGWPVFSMEMVLVLINSHWYRPCSLLWDADTTTMQILSQNSILTGMMKLSIKNLGKFVFLNFNLIVLNDFFRRILIAEYTKIIFCEYLPKIIGQEVMDFYDLNVKQKGFTKYDPKVDPTAIQAVIVAAFRFGHSQVTSHFPVIKKKKFDSYGIHLRSKFNDVSEIWEGNVWTLQLFTKFNIFQNDRPMDWLVVWSVSRPELSTPLLLQMCMIIYFSTHLSHV